jgi:branched-chain amino acid transport system permease protein
MASPRPIGSVRVQRAAPVVAPLVGLGLLMLAPAMGLNAFWQGQVILMASYALVVSGVNLTFGYAGELALGQVGVFAVGAYVAGWLSLNGYNDVLLTVLAAVAAGALVGLLSGLPGLRIGGWALAMTSFFLVILIPDLTQIIPGIGGDVGLSGIPNPRLLGAHLSESEFMIAALVVMAVWLVLFRNFVESRHGIALKVLRESRDLTATVGTSVYRLKLTAYIGGAIPAAIGGVLFAYQIQFVGPSTFDFTLAIGMIAGSVIGGTDSVYGAVAGGALLEYVNFKTASLAKYSIVGYGVVLLIGGVLVSGGLASFGRAIVGRLGLIPSGGKPAELRETDVAGRAAEFRREIRGSRLTVTGVSKSFGAVHALRDVSLEAEAGQITAVIGPNGSGKTTLLNVIAGVYQPESGVVSVDDIRLPPRGAHLHARMGIARTFQTPVIPKGLRAWEVVAGGRYQEPYCSIPQSMLRTPKSRRLDRDDYAVAMDALERLGLGKLAEEPAPTLSLGHRRLLEVGRALVRQSGVVLLDEAASGLDEADIQTLATVLRQLRQEGATIILVEHNFPLVVELADVVYVLDLGQLIATGTPDRIQNDPKVISSYLGEVAVTTPPVTPAAAAEPAAGELR